MKKEKLIKGLDKVKDTDIILYCFPYAGAGASAFRNWQSVLPDNIKVCAIQLPGREERIKEKPYLDMEILADDLSNVILKKRNDYIMFGHSMGTKILYEVERRLENKGKSAKLAIISAGRVPHITETNPIYNLPQQKFKEGVIKFNGMPKEILENKDLFEFFIPVLRADFTLDESYTSKNFSVLNSPIFALWGTNDKSADLEEILKWRQYTNSDFCEQSFEGEHFFIKEKESNVLRTIAKVIENTLVHSYAQIV